MDVGLGYDFVGVGVVFVDGYDVGSQAKWQAVVDFHDEGGFSGVDVALVASRGRFAVGRCRFR